MFTCEHAQTRVGQRNLSNRMQIRAAELGSLQRGNPFTDPGIVIRSDPPFRAERIVMNNWQIARRASNVLKKLKSFIVVQFQPERQCNLNCICPNRAA
jgi:hypothetical protein